MFKPSLRKSILSDNLCLETEARKNLFADTKQRQQPKVNARVEIKRQSRQSVDVPSMMIPHQLLQKTAFHVDHPSTHVFTPLTYDFQAYPRAVQQLISPNPNAAQAGKIQQLSYLIYEKCLFLWTYKKGISSELEMLKMHKFNQTVDLVEFTVVRNNKIFINCQSAIVMAVVFKNRMKLFRVNMKDLLLEDMMLKYQLKGATKIQCLYFTQDNELIFAGNNCKLSMISLNSESCSSIITIQSPNMVKKYLSSSAFDYSTKYNIRAITKNKDFVYCLYDKIKKKSYLMYMIKKAVNKVVRLENQPKYIIDQTFIDVFRLDEDSNRKSIRMVDQIEQNVLEKKIKQGYVNFQGDQIKDGFRIMGMKAKHTEQRKGQMTQMKQQKAADTVGSAVLRVITKCGYAIDIVHRTSVHHQPELSSQPSPQATSLELLSLAFTSQPSKLPSTLDECHFFEPKSSSSANLAMSRKNQVIRTIETLGDKETLVLMNDCLMLIGEQDNKTLGVVRFGDLKTNVRETTVEGGKEVYISREEFNNRYVHKKPDTSQTAANNTSPSLFPQGDSFQTSHSQYRLFNTQRRFTAFDNTGRIDVYLLQLRHIIIAYLNYYDQLITHLGSESSLSHGSYLDRSFSLSTMEVQLKLEKILQRIVSTWGYCATVKALVEILTLNTTNDREFVYFQRELFVNVIRKEFQSNMETSLFEDWGYSLTDHQGAQMIVCNDAMLHQVWLLLFQNQLKSVLTSEVVTKQKTNEFVSSESLVGLAQFKLPEDCTAYGYALRSIFYDMIGVLVGFRARQFKDKERMLRKCQRQLSLLYEFVQSKKKKSSQYRYMIESKLMARKKEFSSSSMDKFNLTSASLSLSPNVSRQQTTTYIHEDDSITKSLTKQAVHKSNFTIEQSIIGSIEKIVTLVDVMGLLIEKDEREGVPMLMDVLARYVSQLRIGELLFEHELVMKDNVVGFLHPELITRVLRTLPQLEIDKKIQYLKFKMSRNLMPEQLKTAKLSHEIVDLKSLDLQRLSQLVSSSQLSELSMMFLPIQGQFSISKANYYIEFLTICLTGLINRANQLAELKSQKFSNLSEEVKKTNAQRVSLSLPMTGVVTNVSLQKILLSQQRLQYCKSEMAIFYDEIIRVFKQAVSQLSKITGPQYYESEKYLERIIETLIYAFANEEILVQSIKLILKDANMVDKVQYVRNVRRRMEKSTQTGRVCINFGEKKEAKIAEKSTFEYLLTKSSKHLNTDRTLDTWRNNELSL